MPECKQCGQDADELVLVKIGGKKKKVCEECAEDASRDEQMAEASEAAVQQMMGFTGRR
jgi:protein-arginine kinase activator protein McsA